MDEIRTLIDYATGDNWEMPPYLYERYHRECIELQPTLPKNKTCIEYWLSTLSEEDKKLITKK